MSTKSNSNTKLILILIVSGIGFAGVLGLLYFTFGNNSVNLKNNTEVENPSVSSQTKPNKTFDEAVKLTKISSSSQIIAAKIESKSSVVDILISSISSQKNQYEDEVIGKELKLPVAPKLEYNFDSKDKEIISKYIKTDFENKIISKLKDGKNPEIIAFQIPKDKIDPQTKKYFPKTFKFSNENRKTQTNEAIFLYYVSEKRIAYLGNFISNIAPFNFESQEYWIILYNGELLISKPNFSDWKKINLDDVPVKDLYKKSEFEFQILKLFEYEDIIEYKIETVSPQKYIIDGIFNESGAE